MLKKILKSSLILFMTCSLILTPQSQIFAASLSTNNQSVATLSVSDSLSAAAQKRADILTKLYGVTSVQYALIQDGKIILSGTSGYTDKKSKQAPTQTTMYGIGSVSKIFTTLAVLKLCEEGKVDLDTPVTTYIPTFTMADSRYKNITVRMLLNHSSGLMGSTLENCILLGDTDTSTHDKFLKLLKTQRLKADPGAFSVYCNDGFTLAEILIETVSGKSFSQFIAKNFTEPLAMTNTKTPSDVFKTSKLAGIYMQTKTKLPYETLCAYGAGGIYSTAADLCKLSTLLTNQTDLLSPELVDSMKNKEYENGQWYPEGDSALSYGLGWDSVNTYPFTNYDLSALVKGGDSLYYHCGLTVLPDENMAVAVLSSGGSSSINELFGQSVLLDALKEKGSITSILPDKTFQAPDKRIVPEDYLSYAGYYGSSSLPLKVEIEPSGTLSLITSSSSSSSKQEFIYTGNKRFYSLDGSTYLTFVESNGNVYLYTSGYSSLPSIGQTALSLYCGEKLKENNISEKAQQAWAKYLNKNYYLVSEKYSSALYTQGLLKTYLETTDGLENYIFSNPITSATSADAIIKIPGVYSRDLGDYKLIAKDGIQYLKSGQNLLISGDTVTDLTTKKSSSITIPKTGYAQYYKIGKQSANKKIKVTVPKKASFMVYDKKETMVFSSYISNKNTVKLPKGGTIVFVGSKKASFTVNYVSK
ncbi:MAG: serine hydrolase domain-containing protein [Velocimicrobium sp.]